MLRPLHILLATLMLCACNSHAAPMPEDSALEPSREVIVGAQDTATYMPLLRDRRVAVLANHTAMYDTERHIVDMMHAEGINIVGIFAPEHGFRGAVEAGAKIEDGTDSKTGIAILSLYNGNTQRPSDDVMRSFDVLVVDMQDVGLRFYTYYISMLRMVDACADFGCEVVVLDRPNPNGHYVDGPILDMKYKSGVGWLPIPVVHGMTMGEIATMAIGEGWAKPAKLHRPTYPHNTPSTSTPPPASLRARC